MPRIKIILITLFTLLLSCDQPKVEKEQEDLTYLHEEIEQINKSFSYISPQNYKILPEYIAFYTIDTAIKSTPNELNRNNLRKLVKLFYDSINGNFEKLGMRIRFEKHLYGKKSYKGLLEFQIQMGYKLISHYYKTKMIFHEVMGIASPERQYNLGDSIKIPIFTAGINTLDPCIAIIESDTITLNKFYIPTFQTIARKKGIFKKSGALDFKGNSQNMRLPFEFSYKVK